MMPISSSLLFLLWAVTTVAAQGNGNANANGNANGNGPPPAFVELPIQVQEKFATDNLLKKSFKDYKLQKVKVAGNSLKIQTTLCTGGNAVRNIFIPLGNLKRTTVMGSTECHMDGVPVPCPQTQTFVAYDGDAQITLKKNNADNVESIQVVIPGCGVDTFMEVTPDYVTSIPAEAYDPDELAKHVYGDADALMQDIQGTRNLRTRIIPESTTTVTNSGRSLQACPTKKIKLALAFDSSYCSNKGGYNQAKAALETTVAGVAALYEAWTCFTFEVGYLDGYCDAASDPYKAGVDLNLSGCGNDGMLQYFKNYWDTNMAHVDRDMAHFAGGTGLECNPPDAEGTVYCIIGCAWQKVMCNIYDSGIHSYGVNYMTYSTNQVLMTVLLAHEMGHTAGSDHDAAGNSGGVNLDDVDYIMEPYLNNGANGFSPFSQGEFMNQNQNCLDDVVPPTPPTSVPTTLPSSVPTSLPTEAPTSIPTNAPTTAQPTSLPTEAPTSIPTTSLPTNAPTTEQPTSLPTDAPTTLPTHPPTLVPTDAPTSAQPTILPTAVPTPGPTEAPTPLPTDAPTSAQPTALPTDVPTPLPTEAPTPLPTDAPTSLQPTPLPTFLPAAPERIPVVCSGSNGGACKRQPGCCWWGKSGCQVCQ